MDPQTILDWTKLVLAIVTGIAQVIVARVADGDATVLDLRVRDILPTVLLTTLEKAAADAAAAKKFPNG